MYPIYKDFKERAKDDEFKMKKYEEPVNNDFDKLLKEIIHE